MTGHVRQRQRTLTGALVKAPTQGPVEAFIDRAYWWAIPLAITASWLLASWLSGGGH